MSEYQYYEWRCISRTLTASERTAVSKLSSHIEVGSSSAIVEYHWSDFKHHPFEVLARYFDLFLYYNDWGSRTLAFRLPKGVLHAERLQPYLLHECVELKTVGDYYLLSLFSPEMDEPEPETHITDQAELAYLRQELLEDDLRVLYLCWLYGAPVNGGFSGDYEDEEYDDVDDGDDGDSGLEAEVEPPIPPGLGDLSAAQTAFVNFMGIDPFLIQAAAQASPPRLSEHDPRLERAVEVLPNADCVDYLKRLLRGEANLQSKLRRRLQQIPGLDLHESFIPGRRTYSELRGVADGLRRNADIRAKAKAEANRVRELRAFAAQAPGAWQTVEAEIERKNASSYDRAVALLVKLRDLAVLQNEVPAFRRQLDVLLERYKSRPGFQDRVRKARL